MKCMVCNTEILIRDGYFWGTDDKDPEGSEGPVHDDCMIRDFECCGLTEEAKRVFKEASAFYAMRLTLPRV